MGVGGAGGAVQQAHSSPSHNSSQITAPSSRSPSRRGSARPCCFRCVCHFLQRGHIFHFYYGSSGLTGVGTGATWTGPHACFLYDWLVFSLLYTWVFGAFMWQRNHTRWTSCTDTLDFPSPRFILWLVSLRKQGSVSCGWSCNGTKMRGKFLFRESWFYPLVVFKFIQPCS